MNSEFKKLFENALSRQINILKNELTKSEENQTETEKLPLSAFKYDRLHILRLEVKQMHKTKAALTKALVEYRKIGETTTKKE